MSYECESTRTEKRKCDDDVRAILTTKATNLKYVAGLCGPTPIDSIESLILEDSIGTTVDLFEIKRKTFQTAIDVMNSYSVPLMDNSFIYTDNLVRLKLKDIHDCLLNGCDYLYLDYCGIPITFSQNMAWVSHIIEREAANKEFFLRVTFNNRTFKTYQLCSKIEELLNEAAYSSSTKHNIDYLRIYSDSNNVASEMVTVLASFKGKDND